MKFLCVTNRKLCPYDFIARIHTIAKQHPHRILLREKDLDASAYRTLAQRSAEICRREGAALVIHSQLAVAKELGIERVHLPFSAFLSQKEQIKGMKEVGVSVHTVEEAVAAQTLGAHYLIAGHIYATDCKKGLPPRGISFLKEIVSAVDIPVFPIGGITPDCLNEIQSSGAQGFCIMSPLMTCDSIEKLFQRYRDSMLFTEIL